MNEYDPEFTSDAPRLLDECRVDLVALIERGIPEAQYVPGLEGVIRAGKRYLIPASAGTGKSLALLRIAYGVIKAGGTVAILDVENGSDEYARRLECIIKAVGPPSPDEGSRLRYYEWPRLSLKWAEERWAAEFAGVDLVVFDSSRLVLSQVGLQEDKSDDYAEFVNALLLPLAKAGIATITLDNTGHDGDRARGTKAKEDLNEAVYQVSARGTIDLDSTGTLMFKLTRTRFGGLHRKLEMTVGGGAYDMPQPVEDERDQDGDWRPTVLMDRVASFLEQNPGATHRGIRDGVTGKAIGIEQALKQLIKEGYVKASGGDAGKQHSLLRPFI